MLLETMARHFSGRWETKLLVPVKCVVVQMLLLDVRRPLQWTPLRTALAKRPALRNMTLREWCRLPPPTLVTLTLLQITPLLRTLQKWPTRPATAAPLVFADFIKVIPLLGRVQRSTLRRTRPLGPQEKLMLKNWILLASRAQWIDLLDLGIPYV